MYEQYKTSSLYLNDSMRHDELYINPLYINRKTIGKLHLNQKSNTSYKYLNVRVIKGVIIVYKYHEIIIYNFSSLIALFILNELITQIICFDKQSSPLDTLTNS